MQSLVHLRGSFLHLLTPGVQSPMWEHPPPPRPRTSILPPAIFSPTCATRGHWHSTAQVYRAACFLPAWVGGSGNLHSSPPFLAPSPFPLGSLPNPLTLRVTSLDPGTRCFIFSLPPLPLGSSLKCREGDPWAGVLSLPQ